jgi:hypothetical protein
VNNGVFLDTSFLISLANPREAQHAIAVRYYKHFLELGMPMGVSAIAISEFCVRQKWETMPTEHFILEPFSHEDGRAAASLDFKRHQQTGKDPAPGSRQLVKDDFKIIGHAHNRGYSYLMTGDHDTMFKYCEDLKVAGSIKFKVLSLEWGFRQHPFDTPVTPDLPTLLAEDFPPS